MDKTDSVVELLLARSMAERYAEFAFNMELEQSASADKLNKLAQAGKSYANMLEREQRGDDNPQPPTILELLAEIKGRIRIPKTFVTPAEVDPGPGFWRELNKLLKSINEQGDDIPLTHEQYENWIKRAEGTVESFRHNYGYSPDYCYSTRGQWLRTFLEEHGVEAFNALRERHPAWGSQFTPSRDRKFLLGVNLSGLCYAACDLHGIDLSYCFFRGSSFWKTSIAKTNLTWANLSRCDLHGIDLREANLSMADLRDSDLTEADLRGANLFQTDLNGTRLAGAKLEGAEIHSLEGVADLAQVNLYGVKGLFRSHYREYVRQLKASIQFDPLA